MPLSALIMGWILLGIESVVQNLLMASVSLGMAPVSSSTSLLLMKAQQFSIGVKSGELPGQSMVLMLEF
jgi:hypothetical protein